MTRSVNQSERAVDFGYKLEDLDSGECKEADCAALIDVTETARRVGFGLQTFLTASLYRDISDLSSPLCRRCECYTERLWDVLFVGRHESGRHGGLALNYRVEMPVGKERIIMVRAVFAGHDADDAAPSLTLMRPEEGPNSSRR